ncbi:MAG: leucine-rich repeat protein [Ruminococcus sp.]|nr:leucine-rich repeat protein [Ruminococcus sp.]
MNKKKLFAGSLSLAMMLGTAFPLGTSAAPSLTAGITALASDYEEVEVDGLTYAMYSDHAELKETPSDIKGEFVIPSTANGLPVTSTWSSAFWSKTELTGVFYPASVTDVSNGGCFVGSEKVEKLTVDENNPEYCSVDNIIMSKDKKTLILLPPAYPEKEFAVPETIESIDSCAFYNTSIESIIMPENVKKVSYLSCCRMPKLKSVRFSNNTESIGSSAFKDDVVLESADIPASVKKIDRDAFVNCTSLGSITINNPECKIADFEATLGVKETTVIRGYAGSTAQTYAEKWGYRFEVLEDGPNNTIALGDPTGDGKIDANDATFVLVEYAKLSTGGESTLTEAEQSAADVNKDGKTDSKDASVILAFYSYLSTGGDGSLEDYLTK